MAEGFQWARAARPEAPTGCARRACHPLSSVAPGPQESPDGSRRPWNFFSAWTQYTLDVDDAALLRRAHKGDDAAFSALFERYQQKVYQYACRMCGRAAADDVVQETFLAVLRARHFDAAKGTVASYLFGIARHHVIRHLSGQGVALLDPCDSWHRNLEAPQETPFDTMAREQTIAAVHEAVQSLSPLHREVIVLCDLQEMDYTVAADVIQCPIGTVRSRLNRARALLATKLASEVGRRTSGRKHG